MAIQLQPTETGIWRIVQAIIQLVNGRHNAGGIVTLRTGQTTTVVTHPNCSMDCYPQFSPTNAAAAAEVGAGTIYISLIDQGSFTLTHASAGTTRTFSYTVTGG